MRWRASSWRVLACVVAVSTVVYVESNSTAASTASERSGAAASERQFRYFPDAAELLALFDSGAIEGSRRPTGEALGELQIMVDDLNRSWHEGRTLQHALIASVAEGRVRRGEVAPHAGTPRLGQLRLAEGALGTRLLVNNGRTFLVHVFPGESPELDEATAALAELKEIGDSVIRSYFE